MYLARRFRKILIHSSPNQIDNQYDINTFTQNQLKIYVQNESKLIKDFIDKLDFPVSLLEIYNNLDNMDISIGKRVAVRNWLEKHGMEFISLEILPNYVWVDQVGKGGFSTAHLVNNKNNKYAEYKVVKITKINRDRNDILAFREIDVLKKISHPYIVKLYDFGNKDKYLWCLLEYCFLGSLLDFGIPMVYRLRYRCISHCIEGISYLHSKNVMHRDIKCGNIFVKGEEPHIVFKLGDFNLAKDFNEDLGSKTWSKCGTLNYMAPELLSNKTYDEKCDLWSFLCVLLEINLTQPMFNPIVMSTRELKNKADFSETELHIITLLHKITPTERATAHEINKFILDRPISPILDPPSSIIRKRSASLDET